MKDRQGENIRHAGGRERVVGESLTARSGDIAYIDPHSSPFDPRVCKFTTTKKKFGFQLPSLCSNGYYFAGVRGAKTAARFKQQLSRFVGQRKTDQRSGSTEAEFSGIHEWRLPWLRLEKWGKIPTENTDRKTNPEPRRTVTLSSLDGSARARRHATIALYLSTCVDTKWREAQSFAILLMKNGHHLRNEIVLFSCLISNFFFTLCKKVDVTSTFLVHMNIRARIFYSTLKMSIWISRCMFFLASFISEKSSIIDFKRYMTWNRLFLGRFHVSFTFLGLYFWKYFSLYFQKTRSVIHRFKSSWGFFTNRTN